MKKAENRLLTRAALKQNRDRKGAGAPEAQVGFPCPLLVYNIDIRIV